jgi:hypothetical protein
MMLADLEPRVANTPEPPATALAFFQSVYRDPSLPTSLRLKAAALAKDHESPKLAVAMNLTGIHKDFATLLAERRLAKRKAAPVIDAVPVDRENLAGPMPRLQRRY